VSNGTRAVRSNWAIDTDAQVRPLPSVAPLLVRRSFLRYVASRGPLGVHKEHRWKF
jgi:hypothetical protein